MSTSTREAQIRRLSALGGEGTGARWIADLGADIRRALADCGEHAEEVVRRIVDGDTFRPSPSRIREVLAVVQQERRRPAQGCADCVGTGWRGLRLVYRRPDGSLRDEDYAAACRCERGAAIARGLRDRGEQVLEIEVSITRLMRADLAPAGQPGLIAWHLSGQHGWEPRLLPAAEYAREVRPERGPSWAVEALRSLRGTWDGIEGPPGRQDAT